MILNNKKILSDALKAVEGAKQAVNNKRNEEDRRFIVANIGKDLVQLLIPLLQQIAENAKITKSEMTEIIKQIKVESPSVNIKPAQIKVDAPIIPEIKIPEIKFPKEEMNKAIKEAFKGIKFPKQDITIPENWYKEPLKIEKIEELIANLDKLATAKLNLDLGNINRDNPLPVILTDEDGTFYKAITEVISKGGGGGMSAGSLIGWIEDHLSIGPAGSLSVYIQGASGTTGTAIVDSSGVAYSGTNPLPVLATVTPGATYYASQAIGSTNIIQLKGIAINTDKGYSYPGTMRVVHATDVGVSVYVSGATGSLGVNLLDSSGIGYSGSNPLTVQISGMTGSTATALIDSSGVQYSGSNPLPVSGDFGSGGTYYASDAIGSTNLIQLKGVAINTDKGYSYPATMRVVHATDVGASVNVLNAMSVNTDKGYSYPNTLRVVHATDVGVSTNIIGGSVAVSGITGSLAVNVVDSSGVAYSGSNPIPVAITSGASNTTATNIVDSSGVAYSGSNPLPITGSITASPGATYYASDAIGSMNIIQVKGVAINTDQGYSYPATLRVVHATDVGVSTQLLAGTANIGAVTVNGATNSLMVVGPTRSDAADDGSAPLKNGGIARQANPTAVGAGDIVSATFDDLGRQVMKVHQVRDMIATAYVSLTNGTETTLLAAAAGYYHDLIYIMGSNTSSVAATVSIRPKTAGNIVMTLRIPANGTTGVSLPVAIPQFGSDGTGNNWTADLDDVTGTTVYLSALFSKEL